MSKKNEDFASELNGHNGNSLGMTGMMLGVDLPDAPSSALAVRADGTIQVGSFTLTTTGLRFAGRPDEEEWQQVGDVLRRLDASIQWLIGDWVAYGERVWGKTYEALSEATGYKVKTLRDYAYVARNVQMSIRIDTLTFAHHQLVSGLSEVEQTYWLEQASEQNWTVSRMREAMNPKVISIPDDPIERAFDGWIQKGIRLGQGDQQRYVEALRRAADQIERSWEK